jgi:hypothetical protein
MKKNEIKYLFPATIINDLAPVTVSPLDFCNDPTPGKNIPWPIRPLDDTSP